MKPAPDPTAYSLFPLPSSPIPRPRYLNDREPFTNSPDAATDDIDANTTTNHTSSSSNPDTNSNSNANPNPNAYAVATTAED